MDNIEKLLLIVLFIAILYYPLCGIVGFIDFVQCRKREINGKQKTLQNE